MTNSFLKILVSYASILDMPDDLRVELGMLPINCPLIYYTFDITFALFTRMWA